MNIFVACPAPPRSRRGNRVSALRWARLLRELGHRVVIGRDYRGETCDLMIALHARKSYPAIASYRKKQPNAPLIICLTGTDLYRDLPRTARARQALEWADRIVVLQPKALESLPAEWHVKAHIIRQSVTPVRHFRKDRSRKTFDLCVLGHLRSEKDPLCAARALRRLPPGLPVRVVHAGAALTPAWDRQARAAMRADSRYRWRGEIPRWRARRLLAASDAMVISSRMEGGANVVSEAIVQGVPVLASRIPGNVGILGEDYPGYFPVGEDRGLANLIDRMIHDPDFRQELTRKCQSLAPSFQPKREKAAWRELLRGLCPKLPSCP